MKKIIITLILGFFSQTIFSCSTKCTHENLEESSRKKVFIKIIDFIRKNDSDSISKYVIGFDEEKKEFNYNILDRCNALISKSNQVICFDSIYYVNQNIDSLNLSTNGISFYKYSLNFYDSCYLGKISMTFGLNDNEHAINIFEDIRANAIDTNGLMDAILKF